MFLCIIDISAAKEIRGRVIRDSLFPGKKWFRASIERNSNAPANSDSRRFSNERFVELHELDAYERCPLLVYVQTFI